MSDSNATMTRAALMLEEVKSQRKSQGHLVDEVRRLLLPVGDRMKAGQQAGLNLQEAHTLLTRLFMESAATDGREHALMFATLVVPRTQEKP
jgi:hypothetical protein